MILMVVPPLMLLVAMLAGGRPEKLLGLRFRLIWLAPVAITRACLSPAGTPTPPSCGCAGKNSIKPEGDAGLRNRSCTGRTGVTLW